MESPEIVEPSIVHEVKEALQARDISDLKNTFSDLKIQIAAGFATTHAKQDQTNGQVQIHDRQIQDIKATFKYHRFIWYILTVAIGAITFLISNK